MKPRIVAAADIAPISILCRRYHTLAWREGHSRREACRVLPSEEDRFKEYQRAKQFFVDDAARASSQVENEIRRYLDASHISSRQRNAIHR